MRLGNRLYSAHLCAAVTFESVSTRCAQSVQSETHFWNLRFPYFSDSCIFQSRDYHPCSLVPRFPVPRFQRPPPCLSHFWSTPVRFQTPKRILHHIVRCFELLGQISCHKFRGPTYTSVSKEVPPLSKAQVWPIISKRWKRNSDFGNGANRIRKLVLITIESCIWAFD